MDIVDRLTNRNMPYGSLVLLDEAAKEIERLRAENDRLRQVEKQWTRQIEKMETSVKRAHLE